jgi:predicted Ser/Thr protein kinase
MNEPVFDGYEIVRKLGSGAMGDVYEAVDKMLERPVALKVLRPEIAGQPELIERFRVEAVALAKLNHSSIATVYAFFQQEGRYSMAMEFVRGRTLEALLDGPARLDPRRAIALMDQTLDGLAHAHGMGVMHRDIKPANIMVTDEDVVKVTDFGIARILGSSRMTREGRIIGTLEYIAPERISGVESDFRSDLYSAGVVLYELLAGRLPFVSDTDYGLLAAHMHQEPPGLADLGVSCPPALEAVVQRALAKKPEERFPSCLEFRQALAAALPDSAAAPLKPTRLALPPTRLAMAPTRLAEVPTKALVRKAVILGTAFAALAICAGLAAYFLARPATPAPAPVAETAPPPPSPAPAPAPPQEQPFVIPSAMPAPGIPALQPAAPIAGAAATLDPTPTPAARETPRRLSQVQKLFVARMDNHLDEYIRKEIEERLRGRLTLAGRRDDADAVLSGGGHKRGGVGSKLSLGFKAGYSASVAIRDTGEGRVLWSAEADDARPGIGSIKRGGPKRVAEKLVETLAKAL